ncbi:MAG: ubiquinol-cytochrome C chaperone family protein [Minwuia sp.]|nr:ubiquinol-cytochrome C chaperone family protein [Minwuia sp.]
MSLFDLIKPDPMRKTAHALYSMAGGQARLPYFYTDWKVADTFDGRFDLLVLHVHLLIRRANKEARPAPRLAQFLFDVMLKDLDQGLRLSGVGDIGIGHRVKKMTHAYYGRATAYDAALDAGDGVALQEALHRNVFRADTADSSILPALSGYVMANWDMLSALPFAELAAERFTFLMPDREIRS